MISKYKIYKKKSFVVIINERKEAWNTKIMLLVYVSGGKSYDGNGDFGAVLSTCRVYQNILLIGNLN